MKVQWNEKMKKMEEGNTNKDFANNQSNVMHDDLEYLKGRNGPFTKPEYVLHDLADVLSKLNGDSVELNQNDTETEKYVQVQETDTNFITGEHVIAV